MRIQTVPTRRLISLLRSVGFEEERGKDHIFKGISAEQSTKVYCVPKAYADF